MKMKYRHNLRASTLIRTLIFCTFYRANNILEKETTSQSREINIKQCRHPVVEQMLVEEGFTPNSLKLGSDTDLIILTGPNASGKSCYLRQIV